MHLPRLFPMLMTAAGTLAPARVFVIGVGVAGLQAIATAKRLGAVVEAYDVRPAVKDQVLSVGAKFVEFDLETAGAEDKGGYAKEQSDEFIRRQQEQMQAVVARNDVVITTAAIPGRKSPVLVTATDGGGDGARLGHRRPGRRARRQLRADPGRRGRRRARRHHPGPDRPALAQAVPRQPDVLAQHRDVPQGACPRRASSRSTGPTRSWPARCCTAGGEVVHPRVRELLGLPAAAGAPEGA